MRSSRYKNKWTATCKAGYNSIFCQLQTVKAQIRMCEYLHSPLTESLANVEYIGKKSEAYDLTTQMRRLHWASAVQPWYKGHHENMPI